MAGEHLHDVPLYASRTLAVRDVHCRPHGPERGGEEVSDAHTIVFPRSGLFVKHVQGEDLVADANQVLFFRKDEPYRVSHPLSGGDDCTSYAFSARWLAEASALRDPAVLDRRERLFPVTHVPSPARCVLLHHRLRRKLGLSSCDAVEVETLAMDVLDAVLEAVYERRNGRRNQTHTRTARAHQEQADAVKTVLAARMRERLTLSEVAKAVHSSEFHLARLFRREAGVPIHRYLNRLRLRAAIERLAEGEQDLTGLALDLGFSSHSHFSDSFRREFNVSPRGIRKQLNGRLLAEMSKKAK